MCAKYVKKWLKMPKSGTLAIIHSPKCLKIKSISDLYRETRSISYATSRIKADNLVKTALDSKLDHEQQWKRKYSVTVYAENKYIEATSDSAVSESAIPDAQYLQNVKHKIKQNIQQETNKYWANHVKNLVVQGRFLDLIHEEKNNITWQSIIYNLPKGILQFITNASIDTLPTNANLKGWGKRNNSKCGLCKSTETLHHVLSNCEPNLERYRWRHDNILHFLVFIMENLSTIENKTDVKIYADLPNRTVNGKTIPAHVVQTSQIPDIVILQENKVTIVELTVPFELNIIHSHQRKSDKYAGLISDIENSGHEVFFFAIEIGCRGYIDKENEGRIKTISRSISNKFKWSYIKLLLSKLAILGSFCIFNSRHEPNWCTPAVLKPNAEISNLFK